MKKCQFCRKADGPLIHIPAESGYTAARRGYRATGEGPHDYHAACLARFAELEAASKARRDVEFADRLAEIQAAILTNPAHDQA